MKHNHAIKVLTAAIVVSLSFAVQSAPPFVTPAMMKRNGLTDEQYELLWKQGKNPQIDVATARDWIFRASRYTNVVEWLEICGRTNDFAKLSHKLQGDNFNLKKIYKEVFDKAASLERKHAEIEVEFAEADKYRKAVKDIEKAARKDTKNLSKLRKVMEGYIKVSKTEEFKELCQLLLEMLPEGE